MRKAIAALAAGACLFAGIAFADTMSATFGNTVTTQGPDGAVVRWQFNADNSYSVTLPDGATAAGTWELGGGQLCVTPTGGGQRQCAPLADGKGVGDTWVTTNDAGESVTVAIIAGR